TAALLTMLLIASPAMALDGSTIDRWIDAMEELQAWSDEQPDIGADHLGGEIENPMNFDFGTMLEQSANAHGEIRSIIGDHGFTPEQWANVGSRIFNAFIAIQMKDESAQANKEMAKALEEMENNPHMSEQQKQMMRQQMQHAQQMMGSMTRDVPAEDRRAVESRKGRLQNFFDVDQ
ncbi:MAG: hypothetical protein WD356_08385, partial [Pseudomonadales bacterium]